MLLLDNNAIKYIISNHARDRFNARSSFSGSIVIEQALYLSVRCSKSIKRRIKRDCNRACRNHDAYYYIYENMIFVISKKDNVVITVFIKNFVELSKIKGRRTGK